MYHSDNIDQICGQIICERPNSSIYKFDGHYQQNETSEKILLNSNNLLLRGMSLKNTDHIYGIVVFTGHETKVMQNNMTPIYKFSSLEKMLNVSVYIIIIIQLFLATIAAMAGVFYEYNLNHVHKSCKPDQGELC